MYEYGEHFVKGDVSVVWTKALLEWKVTLFHFPQFNLVKSQVATSACCLEHYFMQVGL